MHAHVLETHAAASHGVVDVLQNKKPLGQALPHSLVALLSQPLLRTVLILTQLTEEWRSMGWTMTQVSGLAQTLFKACIQWIDGISSAQRAMEQVVHHVREQSRASPCFDMVAEARLREPLYAQCLGYTTPQIQRTPAPLQAGWIGAAQVGPFAREDAGDSSDEDEGKEAGNARGKRRLIRDPAFVDLLEAAEQMEQCIKCGASPCWMDQLRRH